MSLRQATEQINDPIALSSKPGLSTSLRAAILATAAACKSVEPEEAPVCFGDPTTSLMQYEWTQADAYHDQCRLEAEMDAEDCEETEEIPGECNDQRDAREAVCQNIFMDQVNMLPLRECGEPIYLIVGDGPSDTNYGFEANQEDFDGDGVSAWEEFVMGSNPCTANSFASETCETDGEMDYDADGIPNGKDARPLCHGENGQGDPGDNLSDCV